MKTYMAYIDWGVIDNNDLGTCFAGSFFECLQRFTHMSVVIVGHSRNRHSRTYGHTTHER
jgi:hypothetical protein